MAVFKNLTFELFVGIGNLIKNRPKMSGLKLWLRSVDFAWAKPSAALLTHRLR